MTPAQDAHDLGQMAYLAYGETTEFKNFQGNPMPAWAELPDPQKQAWVNAAGTVEDFVSTRVRYEIHTGFLRVMDETAP